MPASNEAKPTAAASEFGIHVREEFCKRCQIFIAAGVDVEVAADSLLLLLLLLLMLLLLLLLQLQLQLSLQCKG